jgi:hypothetical protein
MSTPRLIVKNYTAAERTFIMFLVTWASKKWHNHNPWEPFYKSRSSLARDIGVSQSLVSKMNKKITDGLIPFISREDKVVIGLNHVTHYTVDKDKFFEFCYPNQASNQASKNEPNKLSKKETPSVSNDIPAVSNDTAPTLYITLTNINQTSSLPTLSQEAESPESKLEVRREEFLILPSVDSSQNSPEQNPESPSDAEKTHEAMLLLFNKHTDRNEIRNPHLDTAAAACLAKEFGGSLDGWDEHCIKISKDDFQMGRTKTNKNYKIWFKYAITDKSILDIRNKHTQKTDNPYVNPASSTSEYVPLSTTVYPVAVRDTRGDRDYSRQEPLVGSYAVESFVPTQPAEVSPESSKCTLGTLVRDLSGSFKPNVSHKAYGHSLSRESDRVDANDLENIEKIKMWKNMLRTVA